jgi:hypothetical protein
MMTQLGRVVGVVVGGGGGRGGGGRGDWCREECLSSLHVPDVGVLGGLPSLHVLDGGLPHVACGGLPDEALLGGWFHAGWPDGAGVNWRRLTGGSCPASGTALATEKTIARRTQTARQPRLASQGSLRPSDAFTEPRVLLLA